MKLVSAHISKIKKNNKNTQLYNHQPDERKRQFWFDNFFDNFHHRDRLFEQFEFVVNN